MRKKAIQKCHHWTAKPSQQLNTSHFVTMAAATTKTTTTTNLIIIHDGVRSSTRYCTSAIFHIIGKARQSIGLIKSACSNKTGSSLNKHPGSKQNGVV